MRRKLSENLKRIEQRVAEACRRAKRDPARVRLVAVTKSAPLEVIRHLVELGVRDLGENRVQDLSKRAAMMNEWVSRRSREPNPPATPRWHMIGHLQRNKVRSVLPWIEMIHSVDSLRLAEDIDAECGKIGRRMPVLLEVNVSGEPTKQGVAVAATTHLSEQVSTLKHLELRGLMAMAPLTDDVSRIRTTFERARELFDEVVGERIAGDRFTELSLGMSQDFEHAIEFGSTMVRIGSALFEGIELPAVEPEEEDSALPSTS